MNLNDVNNTWGGMTPPQGSNNNGSKGNIGLYITLFAIIGIGGYLIYKNTQSENSNKLKK
jgi:hypothetical protein